MANKPPYFDIPGPQPQGNRNNRISINWQIGWRGSLIGINVRELE